MREQLWNQRRVTFRHLHDLSNLNEWRAWTGQPTVVPSALEDDTSPDDVLLRLEAETFAAAQSWFKAHDQDADLEVSRQAGGRWAQTRWPGTESDARLAMPALLDSPLGGRQPRLVFLVQRALAAEMRVRWDARAVFRGAQTNEDLTAFERHGSAWIEGFVGKFCPRSRFRHEPPFLVW